MREVVYNAMDLHGDQSVLHGQFAESCCQHCRNAVSGDWMLRSASGKMLKVWCMREVVYNAMDLHGEVFTVKIPFVV